MEPFGARLLAWYDAQRRDLPWRRTRDPWAIWVSEVMLQQTRAEVVRQVFPRFIARYPTPASWASASDDELLSAWKGLGYYRRARLLRDGARAVLARHRGAVPADPDALGALPGIGAYTRGALASIAFGMPETAIDGNVERVAARHRAIEGNVKRGAAARRIREQVREWLDRRRPGDFNQALMELGALVCAPRAPRCAACPVGEDCEARRLGRQEELPGLPEARPPVGVAARAVLVSRPGGEVLGARVPAGRVNGGQLDLPGPGLLVSVGSAEELRRALRHRHGVDFDVGPVVARVRHGITHHRITLTVHGARCAADPRDLVSARPDDAAVPWTTAARKVFARAAPYLAAREHG